MYLVLVILCVCVCLFVCFLSKSFSCQRYGARDMHLGFGQRG